jgi:hypothetical protein
MRTRHIRTTRHRRRKAFNRTKRKLYNIVRGYTVHCTQLASSFMFHNALGLLTLPYRRELGVEQIDRGVGERGRKGQTGA